VCVVSYFNFLNLFVFSSHFLCGFGQMESLCACFFSEEGDSAYVLSSTEQELGQQS
jgi:hypothetical protein